MVGFVVVQCDRCKVFHSCQCCFDDFLVGLS